MMGNWGFIWIFPIRSIYVQLESTAIVENSAPSGAFRRIPYFPAAGAVTGYRKRLYGKSRAIVENSAPSGAFRQIPHFPAAASRRRRHRVL